MTEPKLLFPHDFTWGVATSSFQIGGRDMLMDAARRSRDTFCQKKRARSPIAATVRWLVITITAGLMI